MQTENQKEGLLKEELIYEAPRVESVLTDEDLSRELLYAGNNGPTPY